MSENLRCLQVPTRRHTAGARRKPEALPALGEALGRLLVAAAGTAALRVAEAGLGAPRPGLQGRQMIDRKIGRCGQVTRR